MKSTGAASPAARTVGTAPPDAPKTSSDDGIARGSTVGEPLDADPIRRRNTIDRAFSYADTMDQTSDAPTPGRETYS